MLLESFGKKGAAFRKELNVNTIHKPGERANSQNLNSRKCKKWKPPTKDEYQKGIYNFKPEISVIRDYLDMLHEDHENDERRANIPPIDDCIRRHSEVHDVMHVLFEDKKN